MITSHIVLCGPRKSLGKRYEQLRFGESDENPHTFDLEEKTHKRFGFVRSCSKIIIDLYLYK